MRLRLRLTLSLVTIALLLAAVGLMSIGFNREVEYQVALLDESSIIEVEKATEMALSLLRCTTALEDYLVEKYRARSAAAQGAALADRESSLEVRARLLRRLGEFESALAASRAATRRSAELAAAAGARELAAAEEQELGGQLGVIGREYAQFKAHIEQTLRLAERDPDAAHDFLDVVVEPRFRRELLQRIEDYRHDAQQELSQEVRAISAEAGAAARVAVGLSVAALLLAVLLGVVVSRSIARPLGVLEQAAVRIGRGDLATRVELGSRDELGLLATAFNRMAEDLGRTTVSKRYLDNVIDSMAGCLLTLNPQLEIMSVNRATLEMLGYEERELLGRRIDLIHDEGSSPEDTGIWRLASAGLWSGQEAVFLSRHGVRVPVAFSGSALRDEAGNLQGLVCVAQDLTERKRMEEELRRSLAEKELLLREVHHRVKNNLQVVSSLLDLQSSYVVDPAARQMFDDSQQRIRSMAVIHEELNRTAHRGGADLSEFLKRLATHLLHSYGARPGRIELRFAVDETTLDLDRAVPCGLIVHELVSNCLKHAFPGDDPDEGASRPGHPLGDRPGEIRISFQCSATGTCTLVVADNGCGPGALGAGAAPHSLGMSLVTALVQQLGGELAVRANVRDGLNQGGGGTEVRVEFPHQPPRESAGHGR